MTNPRTIARLEARIKRRAAHCLQFELADPRGTFITITEVKLASDLSSGKILYSVLGDEAERGRVEHMLDGAAGFIQRQVARVLETRTVPHLRWVYDDSIANAARMDKLIQDAVDRDREIDPDYREGPPILDGESEGATVDPDPDPDPETAD